VIYTLMTLTGLKPWMTIAASSPFVMDSQTQWLVSLMLLLALALMMGALGVFIWVTYFTGAEAGRKPPKTFGRFLQMVIAAFVFLVMAILPLLSFANALEATGLGDFLKVHPKPTPEELKLLQMSLTPQCLFHVITGLLQVGILIPPVRWLFHKVAFPAIDPKRRVHTLALMLWVTFLSALIYTVVFAYDPKTYALLFKDLPMEPMAVGQALLFIAFCPLALGWGIKRNWKQLIERLALTPVPWERVPLLIVMAFVAVVAVLLIQPYLIPYTDPEAIKVAEAMSEAMMSSGNVPLILLSALVLSLSAGIGEEIIFRGLLQPVLGWFATNLLFTFMHCHYGFSPLLLMLFVVACLFVYVRHKYGTIAAMITHVSFDFIMISAELVLKTISG
jgi:uncharacterized protein